MAAPLSSEAFDTAYKALNAEQRRAVDLIDGPVFVIAGPGTGKTQVLTLRIANILRQTDTPPDGILALTFTDSAVRTLRERLVSMIGERGYKVRIHTFHSFAQYLVNAYPDHFPRIIGSELATDAERAEFMETALLNTPVQHLRPFGDALYYHGAAVSAISTLKKENVSAQDLLTQTDAVLKDYESDPEKFHQTGKYAGQMKGAFLAEKKRLEKTMDLALVYQAYEDALTQAKRYDYDDVVLEAIKALEADHDLRLQVQESLLYVLADEHQDANRSQNALLELVSGFHERPNLFIVGDEKQAIYRFQGADLDNVHHFRGRYPDAAIVALVENYRSTQPILDSARSLIESSPDERLSRVHLIANAKHAPVPLELAICPDAHTEFELLARSITAALEDGVPAEEIAILVRRNRDVEEVERQLTRRGILVSGGSDADVFGNRYARALLRLLNAVADPSDATVASALLLPGFNVSAADMQKAIAAARGNRTPLLEFICDEDAITEAGIRSPKAFLNACAVLTKLIKQATVDRPAAVAEAALARSGLMHLALAASDRSSSLGAIRALLNAFEDLSRREHDALLPRALETLARLEARGLRLPSAAEELSGAVRVMTAHRAKGREFSHVFIPLLTSRAWSARGRASHFELPGVLSGSDQLEDERRLLYVAITRAKERAVLSYSRIGEGGRDEDPSELLEGIDAGLMSVHEEAHAPERLPAEGEDPLRDQPSADDIMFLRAAFFARGLSATAVNNYLACPWKYFYANLLRIPEIENRARLYGTSIHTALKYYADRRAAKEEPDAEGLIAAFERSLERSPLPSSDIEDLKRRGRQTLSVWWEEKQGTWPEGARGEESVQAHIALGEDELRLSGSLDLIVRTGGGAVVTDYKTGKPKSENELRGNTKDATGDYYRQLAFYQLLLARKEEPERMTQGIIEFVTPDEKGRITTRAFSIPDEDVAELETTIRRISDEILALSFWNQHCGEEDCQYCHLRFALTDA